MSFEYHEPTSLAEAVDLGARFGADGRFLAGGTDLIIQIRRGKLRLRHVVCLHRVPGLDGIDANGSVTLGALVTHRALERHSAFQGRLRALVEGAEVVGGHQVRNVGTVGGNVVNASPAADVTPVLLALDTTVTYAGPGGKRTLPLDGFLVGPGQTALRPGELLTGLRFSALPERSATAFLKAGRRKAMEISVVCVAARLTLDAAGERCAEARIALGAVAPTTRRARAAERALEGRAPTPDVLRDAGRLAAVESQPISDVRASARYRTLVVETLVTRALTRCLERIREAAS
ncbi:MAG TPA: xanthine dehydrogenase family protein subunit M [Candidatus Dormibacteraeota bacterium]|nr:xanthine dehydrogenase family protein subunit M [Candidatus Dormibacteraeota bacterium]